VETSPEVHGTTLPESGWPFLSCPSGDHLTTAKSMFFVSALACGISPKNGITVSATASVSIVAKSFLILKLLSMHSWLICFKYTKSWGQVQNRGCRCLDKK
jgi:hypothetical protein